MSSLLACRTDSYSVLIPVGLSHALDQDFKTEKKLLWNQTMCKTPHNIFKAIYSIL